MKFCKKSQAMTVTALLLAGGWALAWILVSYFDAASPLIRSVLMVACVALIGVVSTVMIRHADGQQRAARSTVEALLRVDLQELADRTGPLPTLPRDNPWFSVLERLKDKLTQQGHHLQDIEDARVSLELSATRSTQDQQRCVMILEGLADPVIVLDQFGEVILANSAAEQLFSFDSTSAENRALANLTHCEQLLGLMEKTERQRLTTKRDEEIELADASGRKRWHRVTATSFGASGRGRRRPGQLRHRDRLPRHQPPAASPPAERAVCLSREP